MNWVLRGGVDKLSISQDKLRINSESDFHWMPHSFLIGTYLNDAQNITIIKKEGLKNLTLKGHIYDQRDKEIQRATYQTSFYE